MSPDTPLLDRGRKYVVLGPDEKVWMFAWENTYQGGEWEYRWQTYYIRPGGLAVAHGVQSEREVFEYLTKHAHKLDSDDKLDLYLFTRKGGLEKFLKENRKSDATDSSDPW